jgi:lysophospholipase L1-like esterase
MKRLLKITAAALAFWAMMAVAWSVGRLTAPRRPTPETSKEYQRANARLRPDTDRVVFMGDSITYLWDLKRSFPDRHFVNRGIGAQTSADMLIRFRQDVINLQPKSVLILAGINDLYWGNGGSDVAQTFENLKSNDQTMAELAELHHIRPVFVSLLPIHDYTRAAEVTYAGVPAGMILTTNGWLQSFCAQHGYQYINLFSAMVDANGKLRRDLSDDGIHPNVAGYKVMTDVLSANFEE